MISIYTKSSGTTHYQWYLTSFIKYNRHNNPQVQWIYEDDNLPDDVRYKMYSINNKDKFTIMRGERCSEVDITQKELDVLIHAGKLKKTNIQQQKKSERVVRLTTRSVLH